MEIYTIEPDCLYAVKYPENKFNEFDRIFEDHGNLEKVIEFFRTYNQHISEYYVEQLHIQRHEIEALANHVIHEIDILGDYFDELIDNTLKLESPDLRGHFRILEGFETAKTPALKSYGLTKPSMIRIYAIEIDKKSLIIFYSGIKLCKSIKDCPVLKDNVLQRADQVIRYLKNEGIIDTGDINQIAK